jgi:hypothetical protein
MHGYGPHFEPNLNGVFREPAAHVQAAIGAIELNIGDSMPMSETHKSYVVARTHFE